MDFVPSNRDFHHWWIEFEPSQRTLPAGWKREPDRLALREELLWDKDVPIPMRDGTVLRADVFRPANRRHETLPALLAWSPYGKTGSGAFIHNFAVRYLLSGYRRPPPDQRVHVAGCTQRIPQRPREV